MILKDVETPQRHIIDELKKVPAAMPDDAYFASLKESLLEKATVPPIIPLYRRKWLIGTAAAAAIAFFVVLNPFKPAQQQPSVDWNSVSNEEVLAYIDDHIADFDATTIAGQLDSIPEWHSAIEQADTTAVALTTQASQELFDELDKEDIIEYLQEEAIELDGELLIGS